MRTRAITFSEAVIPRTGVLREVVMIGAAVGFMAACARMSFYPSWSPVPVTAQTFGALLIGALLGSKRGAASMLSYLGAGVSGLPVFAHGLSGPAELTGPTGGYLFGFVIGAYVVGFLAERGWDRNFITVAAAMLVGDVLLFTPGVAWLSHYVPSAHLYAAGVGPFIPGEIAKIVIASAILPSGWAVLSRFQN